MEEQSYKERLERSITRWPEENFATGVPDAPTAGRLIDQSGRLWVLRRRLNESAARKLANRADEMIIGDGISGSFITAPERAATWASIEKTGQAPDEKAEEMVEYHPFEFDSESGLTLLYLRRTC